jgi:hypothetical protein
MHDHRFLQEPYYRMTRTHCNRKRAAQELQNSYKAFPYELDQSLDNSDDYDSAVAPG